MATRARYVLVISEDAWNLAMSSVIAVPIIPGDPQVGLFQAPVGELGYADASIAQSFTRESLGDEFAFADTPTLATVTTAVIGFLGLDALARMEVRRPPGRQPQRAWPRQLGTYWANLGLEERKRVLIVTPDEHNAVATYSTTLYVTSQDKRRRRRWQVPMAASWAITGDLLLCRHSALELRQRPSPQRATAAEMREVAIGVLCVLT